MADHVFTVDQSGDDESMVVRVRGDIDLSTAARLGEELVAAVEKSSVVVVDLSGVSFLDSTGVRALVDAYRAANRVGHRFYAEGAQKWVAKVLEVTGVATLLTRP